MNFEFNNKKLVELYWEGKGKYATAFPPQVVEQFYGVMAEIEASTDENELRSAFPWRHFEKLNGGDYSLRLHGGFRLTFDLGKDPQGNNTLFLNEIENYHKPKQQR